MSPVQPVDPRVRLAIAQWPPDAARGAVSTFCAEYSISRKTFYAIRKRALVEGQAAALSARHAPDPSSGSRTIHRHRRRHRTGGCVTGSESRPSTRTVQSRPVAASSTSATHSAGPTCSCSTKPPGSWSSTTAAPSSSSTTGPRRASATSATANPETQEETGSVTDVLTHELRPMS